MYSGKDKPESVLFLVEPIPSMDGMGCRKTERSPMWTQNLNDTLKEEGCKVKGKRYEWGPNKIAGHLGHKGFTIDHQPSVSRDL